MKKIIFFILFVIVLGFSLQANAALTTIGQAQYGGQNYNLIWDNDSPFGSIVWLDYSNNWNTWQNQMNWAAGLNSGGVLTYNIDPLYSVTWNDDWRLPATVNEISGYNITSSEMGHLFYTELGNVGVYDINGNPTGCGGSPPYCLTNTGDFQNLIAIQYWSTLSSNPSYAWTFNFRYGLQEGTYAGATTFALAVRPGDVAVVPEPISSILFVTGGMLLAGRRYLRKKRNT